MLTTIASILVQYREGLLRGLLTTLALCLIVWSTGLMFGVIAGALAHRYEDVRWALTICSFLLASVPLLVLLFWLHYPLQELLRIVVDPFITAAFALSLVNVAFVSQIVRDVLDEFPKEYAVAGKVCGLSEREIFRYIQFPIVLRQVIPQLLSLQVQVLQMTLFASLIAVGELFRVAQAINSLIYKPIEVFTTLALFFIAICLPLNMLAHQLKQRYTRNLSEK